MVGAEELAELVGGTLHGVEDVGPDLPQQTELVPEVLHLLAPLVEVLCPALFPYFHHGVPAVPGHPLQAVVEAVPAAVPQRPARHPGQHPFELGGRPEPGAVLAPLGLEIPVLPGKHGPEGRHGLGGQIIPRWGHEPVQGLDQDPGVAHRAEPAAASRSARFSRR